MTKSTALAFGMIAGTSIGAILSAVTNDSFWLGIGIGVGLSGGLALGAFMPRQR